MGCVFPKSAFYDSNPRIFHVWNVDDRGNHVNPGRIEVTETELILYQKGKPPIRWPLRSLRRYGCDAELFSFESGRRCPTGPGIYAFKCHRAEALFNILQECVQNCGGGLGPGGSAIGGSGPDELISSSTPATSVNTMTVSNSVPNGNLHNHLGTDAAGYLEPITPTNHTVHRCSITSSGQRGFGSAPDGFLYLASGNGPMSPGVVGGISPQRIGVVGPPFVQSGCCSGACTRNSNPHYVNDEVFSPTGVRTNSSAVIGTVGSMTSGHQYVNSSTVVDGIHLRNSGSSNQWQENEVLYVNNPVCAPLQATACGSGQHLTSSHSCSQSVMTANGNSCMNNSHHHPAAVVCVDQNTNYARLDDLLKQDHLAKCPQAEDQHFYMNISPVNSSTTASVMDSSAANGKATSAARVMATARSLPRTAATVTSPTSQAVVVARNTSSVRFYANLDAAERTANDSGEEERQMNYIEVEANKVTSPATTPVSNSVASPPCSPFRMPEGYVTIDFDKTAALSNSAKPSLSHDESVRKTRHNGTIPLASPPS